MAPFPNVRSSSPTRASYIDCLPSVCANLTSHEFWGFLAQKWADLHASLWALGFSIESNCFIFFAQCGLFQRCENCKTTPNCNVTPKGRREYSQWIMDGVFILIFAGLGSNIYCGPPRKPPGTVSIQKEKAWLWGTKHRGEGEVMDAF